MSLNEYLRKLGVIGRAKNGKLRRLLSIATLPIHVNKKYKYGRAQRHLAYLIYHSVKETLGEGRG